MIVRAGVYRQGVELRHSGTAQQPIQFIAESPGKTIVDGGQIITEITRSGTAEPIYQTRWTKRFIIDRDGDEIIQHHPPNAPIAGRAELMLCDGRPLLQIGSLEELREGFRSQNRMIDPPIKNLGNFAGKVWFDWQNDTAYFWLLNGDDPSKHQIEIATESLLFGCDPFTFPDGIQHVQVTGFVFRHCSNFAQRPAVWLHGADNLLENCTIETVAGQGVSVNGTLRRCIIRNCGHIGGAASGKDFVNDSSLWEGNSWKPFDRGWEAGGAKITRSADGSFNNCVFRNNGGPGLWLDVNVQNVRIENCLFTGNEASGLMIEISRDITVKHCLFSGNGVGRIGTPDPQDWGVGGIVLAESMNCDIQNCTITENQDGIVIREQGPRNIEFEDGSEFDYHCAGLTANGNYVANNRGYQLALYWDNVFYGLHPSKGGTDKDEVLYDPAKQNIRIRTNVFAAGSHQRLILMGAPWREKAETKDNCRLFGENSFRKDQSRFERPDDSGWRAAPPDIDGWIRNLSLPGKP